MALRRPVYLDAETLMALADYHDLKVPPPLTQVVEKATKRRSAGAQVALGVLSGGGELGKDVELQTSYTIAPNEKVSVSRVIDGLIADHTVEVSPEATLQKDDIVQIEGQVRLTAASLAGKMFYILRMYLMSTDQDIRNVDLSDITPQVMTLIQSVYLRHELVPIPVLVDVADTGLAPRVFVNLRPNLFVDSATSSVSLLSVWV